MVDEVADKCRTAGWGCIDCKRVLADNITEAFAPMRQRASELRESPNQVSEILAGGAAKASAVAKDTMATVRSRMGFLAADSVQPAER